MDTERLVCVYCRREILPEDRHHHSQQAGMKGHYHWNCFILAVRNANRLGGYEIESASFSDDLFEAFSSSHVDSTASD